MKYNDEYFMKIAIEEAKKGFPYCSPNPMVGAVIVVNDEIISKGYHKKFGHSHAEVEAINRVDMQITNEMILYCTLEPCCHKKKKTPPCVDLIIKSGIKNIVIGAIDPNPKVSGKGIEVLRKNGINVKVGTLEKECKQINEVFNSFIVDKLPFIHLKIAKTLDGKICTNSYDSKWITSEDSRKEVHMLRTTYDAIMIGRKTFEIDKPQLDCRFGYEKYKKNPKKIIIGNKDLIQDENLIVINTNNKIYSDENVINKKETLKETLKELSEKYNISSILVEGGSYLISEFLNEKYFHKISIYTANKIIGNGKSFYENDKNINMEESINLNLNFRQINKSDFVLEGNGPCLLD